LHQPRGEARGISACRGTSPDSTLTGGLFLTGRSLDRRSVASQFLHAFVRRPKYVGRGGRRLSLAHPQATMSCGATTDCMARPAAKVPRSHRSWRQRRRANNEAARRSTDQRRTRSA
jgi:hypothetical protein